ncbi:hypothetical protein ACQ4PT_014210 [Festuca glaucescens]
MATPYGLLGLLCFALMAAAASARQFRVGGSKGWSVPDATAEPYNAWAGRMRFLIGDQLLFVYPKETDSVLLVDQASYDACNTTMYLTKFDDGSTVFPLDRSGPFFFISGNGASCMANQKLIVVVLAASHTPPSLLPTPPSMPPTAAAPVPSPSAPSSPPSMTPPSAAPVPSPSSPPSMAPPSGAPMPPPSGAPMPAPESAPSPTGSAPGAAPAATPGSSPPSPPGTPDTPPGSPATPGGAPQPPSDSNPPPGDGSNSTTPGSDAAQLTAGLLSTLAAGFGYAMLAV